MNKESEETKKEREKALENSLKACGFLKEDWNKRQKAASSLMNTCVENKEFDSAEHVLKLYPSTEAIDNLVIEGFKNRWCEGAIKLIEAGLTSKSTLDYLIGFCATKGWENDFTTLIKIRKTPATKEEIDSLRKSFIESGGVFGAINMEEAQKIKLSAHETDQIIINCVNNKKLGDARKAIERWGAKSETIKLVANAWFDECMEKGNTLDIQKAAEMRGRPLSIAEIETLAKSIKAN